MSHKAQNDLLSLGVHVQYTFKQHNKIFDTLIIICFDFASKSMKYS